VVVVPSAFTFKTGEAHWHTLLQARAIENQFYIAGVDQVGWHNETRQTYGHTVAYSPWGELLDSMDESDQGSIYFKVDTEYLREVRAAMPCLKHRRL
jgi:nitrilase